MIWYVRKSGVVSGPFPEEDVRRRLSQNLLTSMDEVSTDGRAWQRIRQTPLWRPDSSAMPDFPGMTASPLEEAASKPSVAKPSPFAWVAEAERMATAQYANSPSRTLSPIKQRIALRASAAQTTTPTGSPPRAWALPTYAEERARGNASSSSSPLPLTTSFSFWKLLTGGVFQRHRNPAELASILSGSRDRAVPPGEYPRTWFWSRIALWSILLTCITLALALGNPTMLPGFFLVGAFGIPVCVVMFFLECDITRCLSAWRVLGTFLVVGVFSLLGTTILSATATAQSLYGTFGAAGAGPVEEIAKESLLLLFLGQTKRYPYILNGLLLGAAIGAGFASFETAGYLFNAWGEAAVQGAAWEEAVAASTFTAIVRAVNAPFCHIAWTASVGGALWAARGTTGTFSDAFGKKYVWGILLLSISLHFLWNLGMAGSFIGFVAWFPLVRFLRLGFEQPSLSEHMQLISP